VNEETLAHFGLLRQKKNKIHGMANSAEIYCWRKKYGMVLINKNLV
jgi:putative hemolysin